MELFEALAAICNTSDRNRFVIFDVGTDALIFVDNHLLGGVRKLNYERDINKPSAIFNISFSRPCILNVDAKSSIGG